MAKGPYVCKFAVDITSMTCVRGAAGAKVLALNYRGSATAGFGRIMGTVTFDATASGAIELCAVSFRDDGSISNGSGKGSVRRVGDRWVTDAIVHSTVSPTMYQEAVLDLTARTWVGAAYEWIPETGPRGDRAIRTPRDRPQTHAP